MIGGVLIGVVGLAFFFLTTSSDAFGKSWATLLDPSNKAALDRATQVLSKMNFWQFTFLNLASSIPRITILIFVEVLAGFFLRQYRTAMEEFRYYEAIERHREGLVAAFLILRGVSPDTTKLAELSNELISLPSFGLLKQGETTAILETAKGADNEFFKVFQEMKDLIQKFGTQKTA